MLNCCLNQLHGCLIPLHGCLFCPTSQASTQEVSDIRLTPPKLSPETAQGAALRPGRDWHSIPNPQSLACRSLASLRPRPPITLRSRRRRNFQKSQPPSSSSPHSASALVPATSGIYRPPPSHASLMFPASPRRPHRFCPSGQAVSRLRTTIAPITRLQRAEAATAPAAPKE